MLFSSAEELEVNWLSHWMNPEQQNPKWLKSQQLNPRHKDGHKEGIQSPYCSVVLKGHRWTECHGEWILSNQIPNDWSANNWIPDTRLWSLGIQLPCHAVALKGHRWTECNNDWITSDKSKKTEIPITEILMLRFGSFYDWSGFCPFFTSFGFWIQSMGFRPIRIGQQG